MISHEESLTGTETSQRQISEIFVDGLADAFAAVFKGYAIGFEPPPPIDFSLWAKENIIFGGESPFPGPYNPDLFPYFIEPLACLQPEHPSRVVVLQGSAQLGKTIVANVFVGGTLDLEASSVMYVHPTIENGDRWVRTKWKPFVNGSPRLRKIFPWENRSRDTANTLRFKERVDGRANMLISGANSASSLAMVSYARQVQDDLAKWQNNDAGDPEGQADKRSQAFEWAKILKISTPDILGRCRIDKNYKRSDMRVFDVPCPHCDHEHPLEWENLKKSLFEGMDFAEAHFVCPECGGVIEHHHKQEMVAKGKWRATKPESKIPGFYIWSAYSPLISWARIAEEYWTAFGDPEKEQTFMTDVVGLPYEQKGEAPPWKEIRDRASGSDYVAGEIPVGALLVTLGIDVQGDRIEWLLKGWGQGKQRFTIQHGVIQGHIVEERPKKELDALIARKWKNKFGHEISPDMTAIDANYETNEVKEWAKRYPKVITVKGSKNYRAPPMVLVKEERNNKGKIKKRQTKHWMVGVSGLKGSLYKQLEKTDPLEIGFCAFPNDLDDEYYQQLASEKRVLKSDKKTGHTEYQWVRLPQFRNEILDMELYAEAAARRLGWHNMSDEMWEGLRSERENPVNNHQLDLLEPARMVQSNQKKTETKKTKSIADQLA